MPNCFRLFKKGETTPQKLSDVDEAICHHFGHPVHPTQYFCGWYDVIGKAIAFGKDLGGEKLRKEAESYDDLTLPGFPKMSEILKFLEDNFVSESWYEHKGSPRYPEG